MSETEHRVGLSREGCGTSQRVVKGVGMRAVRGRVAVVGRNGKR